MERTAQNNGHEWKVEVRNMYGGQTERVIQSTVGQRREHEYTGTQDVARVEQKYDELTWDHKGWAARQERQVRKKPKGNRYEELEFRVVGGWTMCGGLQRLPPVNQSSFQVVVYVNPTSPLTVLCGTVLASRSHEKRGYEVQEIELEYHANLIYSGNVIQIDRKEKVTTEIS
ncbi:hypothetical protein BGW80DRAFT_1444386 [Lactifluus volemus]|nr:hypothetical protein BGW80DRAFT_1444386 [Lactifluus volemus]